MNKVMLSLLPVFFLSVGYADRGAGFVAPTIAGKGNVASPSAGEIIFDTTDTQFWGYSDSATWLPLGAGSGQVMPSGSVLTYAGSTCPTGYLIADGTAISRDTYAALFSAISIAHGSGDGSTTFNLPDYRGLFLRMVDGSAGRDPDKSSRTAMNSGGNTGNNVGSIQTDALFSHTHTQNAHSHVAFSIFDATTDKNISEGTALTGQTNKGNFPTVTGGTATARVVTGNTTAINQNTGGNETRPKNAYVIYCVKY